MTAPKKLPVRPTTDKAKEALFNVLQHEYDFEGLNVLDLFAGTGNICYEFLSRGVAEVSGVDASSLCVKYIKETAKLLGENISIYRNDVFAFLQNTPQKSYHIIFADPPYEFTNQKLLEIVEIVFKRGWLDKKIGMLIVEHIAQNSLKNHPFFLKEKNYGNSVFSFFDKKQGI